MEEIMCGKKEIFLGRGCGLVGRVVASNTRDLRFEFSDRQIVSNINCIEKTKMRKKSPGMAHF